MWRTPFFRWNSWAPTSVSSDWMRLVSVGCVINSALAAAVRVPCSSTAQKVSMSVLFMVHLLKYKYCLYYMGILSVLQEKKCVLSYIRTLKCRFSSQGERKTVAVQNSVTAQACRAAPPSRSRRRAYVIDFCFLFILIFSLCSCIPDEKRAGLLSGSFFYVKPYSLVSMMP